MTIRVGAVVMLAEDGYPEDGYHAARLLAAGAGHVVERLAERPEYDCTCEYDPALNEFTMAVRCPGPWYVVAGGFARAQGAVYAEHELIAIPDDARSLVATP